MGYDYGYADEHGQWIVDGVPTEPPYPPEMRVRVNALTDDGNAGREGTVRHLAWSDDFTFRVQFDDGDWGKYASWEIEAA